MAPPSGGAAEEVLGEGWGRFTCGRLLLHSCPMSPSHPHPDPHEAAPRSSVVDETLLETLLALTPEERLRLNDRMVMTIQELRDGFAAAEPDHAAGPAGRQRR